MNKSPLIEVVGLIMLEVTPYVSPGHRVAI